MLPRKLPMLEPESAFFWTSGQDGKLRIQRCLACGTWQHPPLPRCAQCGSENVSPEPVSGRGVLASFTINNEPWLPGLEVPFVFCAVELPEQRGLYVFSNLLADVATARIGLPVTVVFQRHEDIWLPLFTPETA
ncbi:MAG: DNA-binding protein [Novosphingobium sp.]|uniref:Zn-ribbon domain-containing OB-fold protein n=1 Tax=Novosphingobium sp. TaxID=1874826 RepID=UPI0012C0CF12|nr:zinc ribbon domain-containing protein [Novosphingobium sp.]MPS69910.1 DNA-binding protein [Novosphingobium sp.]